MKKKIWAFIIIGIAAAVVAFILALQLTPWFYAINVRVRFYLDAPANTKINICWDKDRSECLPLVPYSSKDNRITQNDEVADLWLSNLPPRPVYFISLQFPSGVKDANFHTLELDSSSVYLIGYGIKNGAGVKNLRLSINEFKPNGIVLPPTNASENFESKNHGFLIGEKEIKSGPVTNGWDWLTTLLIWMLLFSIYLWVAIPVSMLPDAIRNLGSSHRLTHWPKYSWKIYLACITAGLLMVLLVINAGVLINQYDPMAYLSLVTNGRWFDGTRLPGYPLFLGLSLFLSGYHLDGAILFQAILLVSSVMFSAWTLRKWLSPYVAFAFVVFCLFSPAQINFARWILRESLFASLVILGITAVIAHFTGSKPSSSRWLLFFTIICGVAFLVRENGLLLPFALLPVLAIETIKRLSSSGTIVERLRLVLVFLPRYLLPVIATVTVYVFFSAYNYQHFGYFQVEEQQTSHAFLFRAMAPANFDTRGLLKPMSSVSKETATYIGWPLYSSYIVSADRNPNLAQVYASLYPSINAQMAERGVADQFNFFDKVTLLNQIGRNVDSLIPKRAVFAGFLRQYIYVLHPYDLRFPLENGFRSDPSVYLKKLPVDITISQEEKPTQVQNILKGYFQVTGMYPWYILLFVFALLSSFYILKYQDVVFLAPMTVYAANCAFILYSHMVAFRVFVNIDVLLVLQVALGLSLWLSRNSNANAQAVKQINSDQA